MQSNYLSHMRESAGECFVIINRGVATPPRQTGGPANVNYPHLSLVGALGRLLTIPVIKWEEGYSSFINDISSDNEALDSWCKMITLFTSNLPGDYKKETVRVMAGIFDELGDISPSLERNFKLDDEPTTSMILAYMLCVVAAQYVEARDGE